MPTSTTFPTEFQDKVFELCTDGSVAGRQSLVSLQRDTIFFNVSTEAAAKGELERWLEKHGTGINRFFAQDVKALIPRKSKLRVVLDLELEGVSERYGRASGADDAVAARLQDHLKGQTLPSNKGEVTITSARWQDYAAGDNVTAAPAPRVRF